MRISHYAAYQGSSHLFNSVVIYSSHERGGLYCRHKILIPIFFLIVTSNHEKYTTVWQPCIFFLIEKVYYRDA